MSNESKAGGSNTYIIDGARREELVRLIEQDRYTTDVIGLFPVSVSQERIQQMHQVLDIGCGPGEWCLRVAARYPHLSVIGVDLNQQMVEYAQNQMVIRDVLNTVFQQANVLTSMPFLEEQFDYIHLRFSVSWIPSHLYPAFLAQCMRILKPGGLISISEGENGMTTLDSPAFAQGLRWLAQALSTRGLGFGDGYTVGITPMIGKLLRAAGFTQITKQPYVLETTSESPYYESMAQTLLILFELIVPSVLAFGVSAAEYAANLEGIKQEIQSEDFYALGYGLVVTGQKEEKIE